MRGALFPPPAPATSGTPLTRRAGAPIRARLSGRCKRGDKHERAAGVDDAHAPADDPGAAVGRRRHR